MPINVLGRKGSNGSRGSAACDWSATGHRGASRDPLVCVDQDAEEVKVQLSIIKKIFGYSAITASVITGCYAFASPWLALKDLTKAFENQDTRKIERLIDFPELREDIKATAKAAMMKIATAVAIFIMAAFAVALMSSLNSGKSISLSIFLVS